MKYQAARTDANLYPQQMTCPLCQTEFEHLNVRKAALKATRHDSDFHIWFDGPNPDHYAVIVCPHCWYAAFRPDFDSLPLAQRLHLSALPNLRQEMVARGSDYDFTQPRSIQAAQFSLTLALRWYSSRKGGPHEVLNRMAEAWLRLAWLEREAGHTAQEQIYLDKARTLMIQAYEKMESKENDNTLRMLYLILDLSIRLGKLEEAVTWGHILNREDLSAYPRLQAQVRDRLSDLQRLRRELQAEKNP